MDKFYAAALAVILAAISFVSLSALESSTSQAEPREISYEAPAIVADDHHAPPPLTECNFSNPASLLNPQTPGKKQFFPASLSMTLTLTQNMEPVDGENCYYSAVSKFPRIYIVSDGNWRAPPRAIA